MSLDHFCGFLAAFSCHIGCRHAGTGLGERQCARSADTGTRASNHHDFFNQFLRSWNASRGQPRIIKRFIEMQ
jgi:hypothetical protein